MINRLFSDTKGLYDFNIQKYSKITDKSYMAYSNDGDKYFIKNTNYFTEDKYRFLYDQGISNVLYPLKNNNKKFVTHNPDNSFYISNFIPTNPMIDEVKALNLSEQLMTLHHNTAFKRQLSVSSSRYKMEQIYEYLQYKFTMLEAFVRTIEMRSFDEYSIPILKNYHVILDAKKYMAITQKKIISDIKHQKSVNISFIHNNPKLDHFIMDGGNAYLISIEKSKLGIPSLDIAKFYLENEDLNIDMKALVLGYFAKYDDGFYFDYFTFLVFLVYMKNIVIIDKDYISSQSFITASDLIKKFMSTFDLYTKI